MLAGAQEPDIGRGGGTGGASMAGRVTTVICALEEVTVVFLLLR